LRVHIDGIVWHLDVGSSYPGTERLPKGSVVHRLKWYVSWVQNVVRQFGSYLLLVLDIFMAIFLVREGRNCGDLLSISCPIWGIAE